MSFTTLICTISATQGYEGDHKGSPIRTNLRRVALFFIEGDPLCRHSWFLLAGEIRLPTIVSIPGGLLHQPHLGRAPG
jgi:hypothetical protein